MRSTMREHELFVAVNQELLAEAIECLDKLVLGYRFTKGLKGHLLDGFTFGLH